MTAYITDNELNIINSILSKGNDVSIQMRKDGAVIIEMHANKIHKVSKQFNTDNPKEWVGTAK